MEHFFDVYNIFFYFTDLLFSSIDEKNFFSDEDIKKVISFTTKSNEDRIIEQYKDYLFEYLVCYGEEFYETKYNKQPNKNISLFEKRGLKRLLSHSCAEVFLKKEDIIYLKEKLVDIEEDVSFEEVETYQKNLNKNLYLLNENILNFLNANIEGCKIKIIFSNKEIIAIPYRLEISVLNSTFNFFVYNFKSKKIMKFNAQRVLVEKTKESYFDNDYKKARERFKKLNYINLKLLIIDEKNVRERCIRKFASHEVKIEIKSDKTYLNIKINEYEKNDVIESILELGKYAIVIEPIEIREIVIEKIKKSICNYEN